MKKASILSSLLLLPVSLYGIYAPVPAPEQGSAVTVSLIGGVHWDTNVLGTPDSEIESAVYYASSRIMVGQGTDTQTTFTGYYDLKAFFYSDRPTENSLYNHEFIGTLNHEFSEAAQIFVSDTYSIIDDPESIDVGILQTNQSHNQNRFNTRFRYDASEQLNVVLKFRNIDFSYDNSDVSEILDRNETRAGAEIGYQVQPTARVVAEYRYQSVNYGSAAVLKDSSSSFFLGGLDWDPDPKTKVNARFGLEDRDRSASSGVSSMYATVAVLHKYADRSYLSVGASFNIQETTNPVEYSDEEVLGFFVNAQHAVSGTLFIGGSVFYDNSDLRPRGANASITDGGLRLGLNMTYEPRPNWSAIFSLDYDDVSSDDPKRSQQRFRVGISARYTFGL